MKGAHCQAGMCEQSGRSILPSTIHSFKPLRHTKNQTVTHGCTLTYNRLVSPRKNTSSLIILTSSDSPTPMSASEHLQVTDHPTSSLPRKENGSSRSSCISRQLQLSHLSTLPCETRALSNTSICNATHTSNAPHPSEPMHWEGFSSFSVCQKTMVDIFTAVEHQPLSAIFARWPCSRRPPSASGSTS